MSDGKRKQSRFLRLRKWAQIGLLGSTLLGAGITSLAVSGCSEESISIPSPDDEGKADTVLFSVKGTLTFGQRVTGRLYGTKTYAAYTFESLEGARLAIAGTAGRVVAVYGPEDSSGKYGPNPLASGSGSAGEFTIPEDGRYVAMIGAKAGNFTLTVSCSSQCEQDLAAGRLPVLAASEAELTRSGLDGAAITEYVQRHGMADSFADLGISGSVLDKLTLSLHRVFFSPKVGTAYGWSRKAAENRAFLQKADSDTVDWVPGDVAAPVVDLFRRAENEIKVVMYGMSLSTQEGRALVAAAARGVKVYVYLDVSERDPEGKPYTSGVIGTLLQTPNVSVRVPKFSSKTMHEKFGIVDGVHAFNGSSNISVKAVDVYTEDRFVFVNSPDVAAQFLDEYNRLWNQLGKDAATLVN